MGMGRHIKMDGHNTPGSLDHKLEQEGAGGEGAPGTGQHPEGYHTGAQHACYHDCCAPAKELGVISAELPFHASAFSLPPFILFSGEADSSADYGTGLGNHCSF